MNSSILSFFFILFFAFMAKAQPELIPQTGHYGKPVMLALSPDSKYIASAFTDQRVKIWDASSLQLLKTMEGLGEIRSIKFLGSPELLEVITNISVQHINLIGGGNSYGIKGNGEELFDLQVSPEGKYIAGRHQDNSLSLWEGASGRLVDTFPASKSIYTFNFSADNRQFIYGNKEEVVIWDITKRKIVTSHLGNFQDYTFEASRIFFSAIHQDSLLHIWSAGSGELILKLEGVEPKSYFSSQPGYAFSPDAKLVAISKRKTAEIRIVNIETGVSVKTIVDQDATTGEMKFEFSHDSKQLYCSFSEKRIKQVDIESGAFIREFEGYSVKKISPRGNYLIVSAGNFDKLIEVNSGKELLRLESDKKGMAFSEDEKHFAYVANPRYGNAHLSIIDLPDVTSKKQKNWSSVDLQGLIKSPDGRLLATKDRNSISIWHSDNYNLKGNQIRPSDYLLDPRDFSFRSDGKGLLTLFRSKTSGFKSNPKLLFRDFETGITDEMDFGFIRGNAFTLSPDGKYMFVGEEIPEGFNNPLPYWNLTLQGTNRKSLTGTYRRLPFYPMVYSPDGAFIAIVDSGYRDRDGQVVKLLKSNNKKHLKSFYAFTRNDKDFITHLAFSSDGKFLAAGAGLDIKIWDVEALEDFKTLKGHQFNVNSFCFNEEGSRLLSAAEDGTIRTWNVQSGKTLKSFDRLHAGVKAIVYDDKNKRFITVGNGSELRVWDEEEGSLLFTIHQLDSRNNDLLAISPEGIIFTTSDLKKQVSYVDSLKLLPTRATLPFQVYSMEEFSSEITTLNRIMGKDKPLIFKSYGRTIYKELIASGLFEPKTEFESKARYEERRKEAKTFRHQLYTRYMNALKNDLAQADQNRIARIKGSLEEIELPVYLYGNYDAEKEMFRFRVNGAYAWVKVPVQEAATLKANQSKIKALALRQLQEDGSTYSIFNIKIKHPLTGRMYNFGMHKKPLYGANLSNELVQKEKPIIKQPTNVPQAEKKQQNAPTETAREREPGKSTSNLRKPIIRWSRPLPAKVQNDRLRLQAVIESASPLFDIYLFVNGQRSSCKFQPTAQGGTLACELELQEGMNVLHLEAFNQAGKTVTEKKHIRYEPPFSRKDYALIFVTENYEDNKTWGPLANTILAGEKLQSVLSNRYGFEVELVQNPTLDEMYTHLERYGKRSYQPLDQLLVFFAGHGYIQETGSGQKIGYLVASDSKGKSPRNYLSHSDLHTQLDAIGCKHILLIMDACFSSTFGDNIQNRITAATPRGKYLNQRMGKIPFLKEQLKGQSRFYLSSGSTEVLAGKSGTLSPFSDLLIKSLYELNPLAEARVYNVIFFNQLKDRFSGAGLNPTPKGGRFGKHSAEGQFLFELKN